MPLPTLARTRRFAEVELIIDTAAGRIALTQDRFIKKFSYEFGVNQSFVAQFDLFDIEFDLVETIVHGGGIGAEALFRFGWRGGPKTVWLSGLLKDYNTTLDPSGEDVTLTVQSPWANASHVRRDLVFAPGTRISEAVFLAARAAGIDEDRILVQDTRALDIGTVEIPPWTGQQNNMRFSDWLSQIAELAREEHGGNLDGRYFYDFHIDGTFRFGTSRWQNGWTLYDSYVFGAVNDGRVKSAALTDARPIMAMLGSDIVNTRFIDPDDVANQQGDVIIDEQFARSQTTSDGRALNDTYDEMGIRDVTGPVSPAEFAVNAQEAELLALSRWRLYADYTFIVTLEVLGDPELDLHKMIYLRVIKSDRRPHYMSGYYLVRSVEHQITDGSFVTRVEAIRNAVNFGDLAEAGVSTFDLMQSQSSLEERGRRAIRFSPEEGFEFGFFSRRDPSGVPTFAVDEDAEDVSVAPGLAATLPPTTPTHSRRSALEFGQFRYRGLRELPVLPESED